MFKKYMINSLFAILLGFNSLQAISLRDYSDAINLHAMIPTVQFMQDAFTGNFQTIIDYLGNHGNVNIQQSDGTTALHNAVHQMNEEMTELLLSIPHVNVNLQDKYGYTPLHWATINNDTVIMNMLLSDNNTDIDAVDLSGKTPLHLAAQRNLVDVAIQLLSFGAQTNIRDNSGCTAHQIALQRQRQEIVNLFATFAPAAAVVAPVPVIPVVVAVPAIPVAGQDGENDEQEMCPICQSEDIQDSLTLECDHSFCAACIQTWVATSIRNNNRMAPTCPTCRAEISI